MNDKTDMRREAERVRSVLSLSGDEGDQAAARFMDVVKPAAGQVVAVYMPLRRELDTLPLIEKLRDLGVTLALPVTKKGARSMVFRVWDMDAPLVPGQYNIPEPSPESPEIHPDIAVIPMLAFDRRGTRLGYGMGHYDTTLSELRAKRLVLAVGYAYAEQICLFRLPREEHDIAMDLVVTPQGLHDFRP
jgi:5-formyltetrahydrofolate cyclo-ligase